MTQDYEPIELNENTLAPKEKHSYYLVAVEYDGVTDYRLLYLESLLWFGIGSHEPVAWPTVRELLLSDIAGVDGTVTIQSLAAHDAQIRAEALEFTNEERDLMLKSALDFTETDDAQKVDEMIAAIIGSVVEYRKEQKQ